MVKLLVRAGLLSLVAAGPAAAQVPAGGELLVNTYTTDRQTAPQVAMEPDGDFVVVWSSSFQDDEQSGVFGQRFAASGAPRGGEFHVNTYTTANQYPGEVAVGPGGDFVIVWTSVDDGSDRSIKARRYDAAGSAIGDEFQVNTVTTGAQIEPRLGRASDGRFVVSWSSQYLDGSNGGIAARRFDATGNPVGSDFVVNAYTTGAQATPAVAVEPDGDFVVVWQDMNALDGSDSSLQGQRFSASGLRLGSEFLVNTFTTGFQERPSVSVSPDNGFVVAWQSDSGDGSGTAIFARRFDAAGNPLGSDFVVNSATTGYQESPRVAHDARGNFVVTWEGPEAGSYGSFAQRFSASGARRGAEFRVNTYTTGRQIFAAVASDAVGNFVVAWDSRAGQDGSDYGVFAQRFGGLQPAALAVDAPGNTVLEPGETVQVRPAWRNTNGAPQAFTGTLASITGPAGATYTINDAGGSYGPVPDGLVGACTDCYAASVSSPPTRPAVHWDAYVVESLLPDTQGQQKQWLLHVGGSFGDVSTSSPFYRFIEALLHHGVTGGCSATEYCPSTPTTREQMAVFVLAARDGTSFVPPACATPMFPDVPASSPFCRWIEELARRGVVGGCGGGSYCPSSEVTREQMAVFVLRTLDGAFTPPPCTVPMYDDVPATSGFCRWIEELTRRGVVSGCGGGSYCPAGPVTREQMGVFISVTFGLTLYGP